jgi:hypothetical protein
MYSNPCACEYRHDAAPYNVPNSSASAKIVAQGRCTLLKSGDGKRKDFVQEIESGKNNQHGKTGNSGSLTAFLYIGAQGTGSTL